jgi:hypothetical protein
MNLWLIPIILPIARPEKPHIVKIAHDMNYRIIFMSRAVIPQPFNQRPSFFTNSVLVDLKLFRVLIKPLLGTETAI